LNFILEAPADHLRQERQESKSTNDSSVLNVLHVGAIKELVLSQGVLASVVTEVGDSRTNVQVHLEVVGRESCQTGFCCHEGVKGRQEWVDLIDHGE